MTRAFYPATPPLEAKRLLLSQWATETPNVINQAWRSIGGTGYALSPCYQVTSGAVAPLDVELIDMEVLFTMGTPVS